MLTSLRPLWERVQGTLISEPRVRIVKSVEATEY
jgi:hypothetical protein